MSWSEVSKNLSPIYCPVAGKTFFIEFQDIVLLMLVNKWLASIERFKCL